MQGDAVTVEHGAAMPDATVTPVARTAAPPPLPLAWFRTIACVFFAAKVALLVLMRPYMDETYYFLWGQHPALSYFDHPSLIGWTQGLSATVFGWNMAGLREPVFLTLCGDLLLLYLFARRRGGEGWQQHFWPSAALFLSMPIMLAVTGVAIPDHLLVFCALAALYLAQGFLGGVARGAPDWRQLYALGGAIGVAMLAKYAAVLIGAAFVLTVVFVPRYRVVLRSMHLYLASLLALLLQLPVLIWNMQHDFASFAFIFSGRQGVGDWWHFVGTPGYLAGIVFVVSPFLVWPMLKFAMARDGANAFARALWWLSTLVFLVASTMTSIIVHWNLLAYVAVLPALAGYIRSRLLVLAHFAYAAIVLGLFGINYSAIPIAYLLAPVFPQYGIGDQASGWGYGWEQIAARVEALRAGSGARMVAATDYTLAGELAFALRDAGVTSLSPKSDAFDFWRDDEALAGATAVIVADRWRALSADVRAHFDRIEAAGGVDVQRLGRPIDRYEVYVGTGYRPAD